MLVSKYLNDKLYFENFEEAKKYYLHEEARSIDDLNEILEKEAEGMKSPVVYKLED